MKNTKGSSIEYRSNIAKRKKHGLQEQPELMQVKLTLHIQNNVASASSNDPINDSINDPINLTERQKLILQMFSDDKNLSRERLCEKTGLSDATAKREIAFLKKAGYLERVGSLKTGHWIVVSNHFLL
ncbi:HTH domain-containing protein [Prevotella stercorea]|uniref:HTH domain-containing protein n=1 Tax=Leyella stercorea TaxID=363265 RepID=UPI001F246848|nr:HTH domain-containing protein [Leyella stercorea]MCF2578489.1 HTH domain-containing protein [Leyella stercorea]